MSLPIKELFDLSQCEHAHLFEGCKQPWEVLPKIPAYVAKVTATPYHKHTTIGSIYIGENVCIGDGTIIENGATIKGSAIIGKNCRIGVGAYIRENAIVGDGCVVGNSVEIKHCLLFNNCQVPHYNYIGESVLGYKAHLGAGAICSNYKLMPSNVILDIGGEQVDTGLIKFGGLLGDRAEIGCNTVLNPGTVIGRDSVVYAGVSWRGVLPPRSIVKLKSEFVITEKRL